MTPDPTCLAFREAKQLGEPGDPLGEHRRSLLGLAITAANDIWQNALDLVAAIAHDVQRKPPPVWSTLALARGVLEASLLARYLLDPSISVAKRLARTAGIWHTDALYETRTAAAWGDSPDPGEGMLAYVKTALAESEVSEVFGKSGRLCGFEVDGERAALDMNITDEAKNALPAWVPEPYRLSSGAAHSRPWVIARGTTIAQERGTGEVFAGEAATVVASVMLVVGALSAAHRAWNDFFDLGRNEVSNDLDEKLKAYLTGATFVAHPPTG